MRFPVVVAVACLAVSCGTAEKADLVLLNAVVYTLDPENPTVTCVAVRGETVAAASSDCASFIGDSTQVLDLAGKTVVPGFSDSHAHLSGIGLREMELNLAGIGSLAELLSTVERRVAETPAGEWVTGRGWIEAQWDPPVFPTRHDLDRAAPEHPVWLVRADGHAGVANSAALRLAGIDRNTATPDGGEIMKDSRGEPAGMLVDRAQGLIRKHLPQLTAERLREALLRGVERSLAMGWTQISIAGASRQEIEILEDLYRTGEIPLRIYAAASLSDADWLFSQGPRIDGSLFTVRGIKISMDGALGSKGAALLEPYADHDSSGLLMYEAAALEPVLDEALRKGVQIQTHAIGDRANRVMLDLYEQAFARVPAGERAVADPRWRIEHAQILHPDDIPRFAKLGVIPSMEASHAITDLHFALSRLGLERLAGAYAWRSLVDSGVKIAGGSDAPVEEGDPIVEFYAAAVRRDLKGYAGDHWHPEQRLTRTEALQTLTEWAVHATFEEDRRGKIRPGYWADLTVLSGDLMTLPDDRLPEIKPEMTIVGGKIAYSR